MSIVKYLGLYAGTFAVFILVDLIWLGVVAKGFYGKYLGDFLADDVNWVAAIGFYLFYVFGVLFLVVLPGMEADSVARVLKYGVFLGVLCYATYDLTNLATLKDWPVIVTVVDMIWGGILTGATAVGGFYIYKWLA